jgi:hypothetical protein
MQVDPGDPLRAFQDRIRATVARVQSTAPSERDTLLTEIGAPEPVAAHGITKRPCVMSSPP